MQRDRAIADLHRPGQRHPPRTLLTRDDTIGIEAQRRGTEPLQIVHLGELPLVPRREVGLLQAGGHPTGAAPDLAHLVDPLPVARHRLMPRLPTGERLGEYAPDLRGERRREVVEGLPLPLEGEPEVGEPSLQGEGALALARIVRDARRLTRRVAAHEIHRELRPLDRGPRDPELVGEVAERPRHRPPAPTDARLGDPRLVPRHRLLVDHQTERHDPREELDEAPFDRGGRARHRRGERQPDRPIDARHRERRILDRLHQHPAPLSPAMHALVEELPRESVDLAEIAAGLERLGVGVVGGEVVRAWDDESVEIAILARHPMQRLHACHHRHIGQERIVAVHEEFGPGTIDRHRLDLLPVVGEAASLDDPAGLQELHGIAVGAPVERDGEIECVGRDAQRRAGEGDALGIPRELELRRRRGEVLEADVAIGEDEDTPPGDPPMHTPRHLQDLVRPEMESREDVPPALDEVGEAGVVDHHRVEPAHIERALPGGGHREEEGLLDLSLEEGADHADRFAPVVERHLHLGIPRPDIGGDLLHPRARREEDPDPAPLLDRLLEEAIIEEGGRLLPLDHDLRRLLRVVRTRFDHRRRVQIARIEGRIDRRGEPDEAAPGPLAEGETELELRRGLMDLVDDQGVVRTDVAILEPAAGDPRGDDHHVPAGRLRGGLAFAVHHADAEGRRVEERVRDGAHGQGLPRPGPGDDPEAGPWALGGDGDPLGEGGQLRTAGRPEEGLDVEAEA